MAIKLIAADLDGTLLNEKSEVSALTQKVLLRAQQDGIRVGKGIAFIGSLLDKRLIFHSVLDGQKA